MRTVPKLTSTQMAQSRDEWLQLVAALAHQVHGWAEKKGWAVSEERRDINEERIGAYQVPVLRIDTPLGQVVLEPIARDVAGAEGRVDLYAWPSLYRVMLLRREGPDWVIRTDSGINWPHPWGEATFVELAEGLIGES